MSETKPDSAESRGRKLAALGFGLALVLSFGLCFFSLTVKSPTSDEPPHLIAGVAGLKGLSMLAINPEHPPLVKTLSGLCALTHDPQLPTSEPRWAEPRKYQSYLGMALIFKTKDWQGMMRNARLAPLALFLLGGLFAFLLGRELYGWRAGLLAAVFVILDPNMMAHGRLVTTDVPLATAALALSWVLLRWYEQPTIGRAVAVGLGLAGALGTKYSAVFLVPPSLFAVSWRLFFGAKELRPSLAESGKQAAAAFLTCSLLLWAIFGFPASPLFYYEGATSVYWNQFEGAFQYLNGEFYQGSRLAYFPVCFLVKSALPTLLLVALGAFSLAWFRPSRRELFLLVPFLALALPVIFMARNIGYRYMLPAQGLLLVLVCRCAAEQAPRKELCVKVALILALALGLRSASAYPDYLPFANLAVGGSNNTGKYLIDSNLEWGQDVDRAMARVRQDRGPVFLVTNYRPADVFLPEGIIPLRLDEFAKREAQVGETYILGIGAALRMHHYSRKVLGKKSFIELHSPVDLVGSSMYIFRIGR